MNTLTGRCTEECSQSKRECQDLRDRQHRQKKKATKSILLDDCSKTSGPTHRIELVEEVDLEVPCVCLLGDRVQRVASNDVKRRVVLPHVRIPDLHLEPYASVNTRAHVSITTQIQSHQNKIERSTMHCKCRMYDFSGHACNVLMLTQGVDAMVCHVHRHRTVCR